MQQKYVPQLAMRSRRLARLGIDRSLLERLEERAMLAVITWDGGPLGTGTEFHLAENWDGDVLPGASDDAVIPDIAGSPLIAITQSIELKSLAASEALLLSAGTLRLNTPSVFNAAFTMTGGLLTGAGSVTIAEVFVWGNGSLFGTGQMIIESGATATVVGESRSLGRSLVLFGDTEWLSGSIYFNNGEIVNNGTFRSNSATTLRFENVNGTASFVNNGTVLNIGAGALHLGGVTTISFMNFGVVTTQAGVVIFGAGSNAGQIIGPDGTSIRFGWHFSHLPGSMLSVAGWLRFLGGTHVFPEGTIQVTGAVDFSTGSVTLNNAISPSSLGNINAAVTFNAALEYTGTIAISSNTTTFSHPQTFETVLLSGGTIAGAGTIAVIDQMIWSGGTMSGSGQTVLLPGSTLVMSGSEKILERQIISSAAAVWTAGSLVLRNGALINNGTLAIDSATTVSILIQNGSSSVTNNGLITKAGSGTAFLGAMQGGSLVVSNAGTVSALSGALIFQGLAFTNVDPPSYTLTGGEWIVAHGATLTLLDVQIRTIAANTLVSLAGSAAFGALTNLSTISGALVIESGAALTVNPDAANGTFSNAGSLRIGPGASLTISGDYSQSAVASLNVGIAGIANAMMGRLVVTGIAALGGSLELHYEGGFLPEQGDSLRFVSSSGTSDEFDSISVPPPPSLDLKSPVLLDSEGVRLIVTHIADWNNDLSVSVADIFAFLSDWFAGRGDFNNDGDSSVSDIFTYLSAWFSAS